MKYVTVEIPYSKNVYKAGKWARETFGLPKGEHGDLKWHEMLWYSRVLYSGGLDPRAVKYYFRNPEDATMFALRWA